MVFTSTQKPCTVFNKDNCFVYILALKVANEKDKQYQEEYIQHFDNS